jgi:hypothetical protein
VGLGTRKGRMREKEEFSLSSQFCSWVGYPEIKEGFFLVPVSPPKNLLKFKLVGLIPWAKEQQII